MWVWKKIKRDFYNTKELHPIILGDERPAKRCFCSSDKSKISNVGALARMGEYSRWLGRLSQSWNFWNASFVIGVDPFCPLSFVAD